MWNRLPKKYMGVISVDYMQTKQWLLKHRGRVPLKVTTTASNKPVKWACRSVLIECHRASCMFHITFVTWHSNSFRRLTRNVTNCSVNGSQEGTCARSYEIWVILFRKLVITIQLHVMSCSKPPLERVCKSSCYNPVIKKFKNKLTEITLQPLRLRFNHRLG